MSDIGPALEHCPVSLVVTDRNGAIQWVNRSFSTATGYQAEECLGKNPRLLKSGHHPRAFYEELWGTILSGRAWRGELCNRRQDGERYWESAVIAPYFDASGEIAGFVAVKQEVGRLKRLETRYEKILAFMSEGYLELVEGVVVRANPAAAQRLGCSDPRELVGRPLGVDGDGQLIRLTSADGTVTLVQGQRLGTSPELALVFR